MTRQAKDPSRPSIRKVPGDPMKFIESATKTYDPESEFRPALTKSIIPEFFAALNAKPAKEGDALPDLVESARIIEINRFGVFRVRTINGSQALREAYAISTEKKSVIQTIVESGIRLREESTVRAEDRAAFRKMAETKKFREDFDISPNTNNTGSTNPFDEYIPIMGGPFNHQLYLHDMLDALAKSFEAWNHNPLAHQGVKITTHFVLGRGVSYKARDPLVQKRWSDWWKKNKMDARIEEWSDMLSRDGELMVRKFKNGATKEIFVRWLDPSTIWEIVTDLEDIERVFYYHQQYPTAYQVLYGGGADPKFNPTNFGSSKYVINQIPADEVIHVKINCSPNEKRGRSDLFNVLGWLKRYKDFQTAVVLRAIVQSTFAWKNKLKGTQTDVDAFISEFGTVQPEFGSVYVENEASDLQPMAVTQGSAGALDDCPGIVNAIAVGLGIPKEYFGLSEHGSRATAVVASEPGVKKFQARQLILGRVLKSIAEDWFKNEIANKAIPASQPDTGEDADLAAVSRWVLANAAKFPYLGGAIQAMIARVIGASKPTDGEIEFEFPEIAVEDRSAKIKDLEIAHQDKVISHRRLSTSIAKELGIEEYDYDKEKAEIEKESIESMSSLYPPPDPDASPEDDQQPEKPGGGLGAGDKRDIKRTSRS